MSSQYCFSHSLPRCVQGITDHYWPDSDQIRVTCQTRTFVTVTWHVTWQLWHSVNCLQIGNFTLLLFSDLNCGPCPIWPLSGAQHGSHYPGGTWCSLYSREFEHRGTKNSWYSGSKSWLMQTENKQGGHKNHCVQPTTYNAVSVFPLPNICKWIPK